MPTPESAAERRDRVLRERALLLARSPADRPVGTGLELLVFGLAQESYAAETRYVREVHTLRDLTPLPCTPPHVLGIINLRGEICAVIDLKRLFGLPERGLSNVTRAVIVREGALEFGIVADSVAGVRTIPAAAIQPPPVTLAGIRAEFLRGVTGDGLILLDLARLLAHPSMVVREEVREQV